MATKRKASKRKAKRTKTGKLNKGSLTVLVHSQKLIMPHGYKIVKAKRG